MRIDFKMAPARARRGEMAFTLSSMMVSSGLLILVLGSVLYAELFGARMYQITTAKLGANTDSRKLLTKLIDDAHEAQKWRLGRWTNGAFIEIGSNTQLVGNAIMFFPDATTTNNYVRYYFDTNEYALMRYTSIPAYTNVVAYAVSNTMMFGAYDYSGALLTNKSSRAVLGVNLQFTQIRNPAMDIGPSNYYQSYQMRSKVTLRAQD